MTGDTEYLLKEARRRIARGRAAAEEEADPKLREGGGVGWRTWMPCQTTICGNGFTAAR
jgi:hypothetical protein